MTESFITVLIRLQWILLPGFTRECFLTSQNASKSQTRTSLAGTQGSPALTHLTSSHTSSAMRRNSLFDDRCTSGAHLPGRALSHDHPGELTQQAFPTSRKTLIDLSLFIHILKEMNAARSFLWKTRSEKGQRRYQTVLIPCPSIVLCFNSTHPLKDKIYIWKRKKKKKTGAESPSTHTSVLQNYYPGVITFYRSLALLFPLLSQEASLIL